MNYTENYHLPQWEETDRVMRVDFNAAMERLEAGLTDGTSKREALAKELRSADTTMSTKELGHVVRLAYNHYCAVQDVKPFPNQVGVFHQKAGDLSASPAGMTWRDGVLYAVQSPERPAVNSFISGITISSQLKLVKGNLSASTDIVCSFTSTAPGTLNSFFLGGSASDLPQSGPFLFPGFRLELLNQDTGVVEYSGTTEAFTISGTDVGRTLYFKIPFHGGYRYRLTAAPMDAPFSAQVTMRFTNDSLEFRGGSVEDFPGGTIAFTQEDSETSRGGLFVLRCKVGGKTGSISLKWNGKTIAPSSQRYRTYKDYGLIQEMIYLRNEALPATNSFEVVSQCGTNCEIYVYDWGAILF